MIENRGSVSKKVTIPEWAERHPIKPVREHSRTNTRKRMEEERNRPGPLDYEVNWKVKFPGTKKFIFPQAKRWDESDSKKEKEEKQESKKENEDEEDEILEKKKILTLRDRLKNERKLPLSYSAFTQKAFERYPTWNTGTIPKTGRDKEISDKVLPGSTDYFLMKEKPLLNSPHRPSFTFSTAKREEKVDLVTPSPQNYETSVDFLGKYRSSVHLSFPKSKKEISISPHKKITNIIDKSFPNLEKSSSTTNLPPHAGEVKLKLLKKDPSVIFNTSPRWKKNDDITPSPLDYNVNRNQIEKHSFSVTLYRYG